MKNFNLYILKHNFHNSENPILIPIGASHQSTTSYPQGTYNEKLTNKPNSQAQLTFNISTKCNGRHNRNADLMVNGQRLRIVFNGNKTTCQDFFITKVAPTVSQDNSILAITAVDWFSYELSHTAIGLTYDSLDHGGARSIQDLTLDILQASSVANWNVAEELADSLLPRFYDAEDKTLPMRITFSVSGSNCYNALIEIAKKFDATIVPKYNWNGKGGEVNFINNNDFTSNIYHLSPIININSFGVNQQSNNLATIIYVTGGEDAYGNPVTLTPKMHGAFKYWLLSRMCYDDNKKPGCLEHNYPILYTRTFNDTNNLYTYKKYRNSLYINNKLNRTLNSLSNVYSGLYATYDKSETIVFTLPQQSSETDELLVYIDGNKYNGFSSKVVSYISNPDSTTGVTKLIEVKIPASDFSNDTITLWAGYGEMNTDIATIELITATWREDTSTITGISQIWEAQDTMMDVYRLFAADWDSVTAIGIDQGLAGFKNADITNTVCDMVRNYCQYIDNNVPSAGNFLYNFDYLLKERLITPVEYYGLDYILSHDVRNYNLLTSIYGELYYELKYQTSLSLATIKTYLSTFIAEIETHMQNINNTDEDNKGVNPNMPVHNNILNIVQSREDKEKIVPISLSNTDPDEQVNLDYYTNTCHNQLLEILSNILREGLTSQYVKNCVTLYGKDFFNNIKILFEEDPTYDIFQNKTDEYFNYLYEYDVLLNRSTPKGEGSHNFDYDGEFYDDGRSLEADHILAQASSISKQASYWYDNEYNIYSVKPTDRKVYYHPNYGEIFLNIIEEFVLNTNSSYYPHIATSTTSFNLVDFYEKLLQENKDLWTEIRQYYGNFLWETTYNDSTELTTSGLYNAALLSFSKVNKPIYNYSVTSIDASQLINTGTEKIKVGDRISIHHPAVFPKPNYKKTIIQITNGDVNDKLLKYRTPQKGATVNNFNFTRYNLAEIEETEVDIFDQILGSVYGEMQGQVIDSDPNTREFIIEWENEWPIYGIDLINTLNYGVNLFFGDYSKISGLANYSVSKSYTAGDWFYNGADILEGGFGYKVYQVGKDIEKGTPLSEAIKSAYRVDVFCGATIDNLSDGDLYFSSGKLYQKYTDATTASLQEVISYPVYADFVYEPDELLLTITGITQTLREHSTQLQVQDNSLINSLVDKLLYSVRFN